MTILKTIMAGVAALSLIAAPVLANSDTSRVVDRVGATQEDNDRVPAILLIGAGILLVVILASSNDDDSESD